MGKKVFALCPTLFTVKSFDDEKVQAFHDGKVELLEFLKKFDKFLIPSGDRFSESGMTFGEIDLFCKLYCYANGALPEIKEGGLAAFFNRMEAVPGIKKVLEGQSKFGQL